MRLYGPDGRMIGGEPPVTGRVEIVRSFSYKLPLDKFGRKYESRDFFMSQKAECSVDEQEAVSAALYAFCRREVLKSVREYENELRKMTRADATGFEVYKNQVAG